MNSPPVSRKELSANPSPMDHSIEQKSKELTSGALSHQETSRKISDFVQNEILYYLDEWDVNPVDVFQKGRGMCAGKALLAVELFRALKLPSRFKIIKIYGENDLFQFIRNRLEERESQESSPEDRKRVGRSILSLPPERDHILVQVWLDGGWVDLDLARDKELDYGMKVLGIGERNRIISEEGPFDSIDEWLIERMRRRVIVDKRERFFRVINGEIEKVRLAGAMALRGGVKVPGANEINNFTSNLAVIPGFPLNLGSLTGSRFDELAKVAQSFLITISDPERRSLFEEKVVDWLFSLVRHNVKRGRFWNLFDVLTQRRADCLGYAKLFTILAKNFGLDAGVVEVIRDCRGRYVPHIVSMIRLADGRKRLVDPWYGSPDIRHRLMNARVRQRRKFVSKTMTLKSLESSSGVFGLSPEQIRGIDFYILGNSFFGRGMQAEAISCYDLSIWLFPSNPRAFFNRAVALESMGRQELSIKDYQRAFSMKQSFQKIVASAEDLEQLIDLDEKQLEEFDQQVYLIRRGYITGHLESWKNIGKRLDMPSAAAKKKWNEGIRRIEHIFRKS